MFAISSNFHKVVENSKGHDLGNNHHTKQPKREEMMKALKWLSLVLLAVSVAFLMGYAYESLIFVAIAVRVAIVLAVFWCIAKLYKRNKRAYA